MAVTFVGENSGTSTVGTVSVNLPAGLADGDVAWLEWHGGSSVTYTDPSGWTLQEAVAMDSPVYRRYTKTVNAADSGTTINLSASGSQRQIATCRVFRGVDTSDPEHADTVAAITYSTTSGTRAAPTVTTTDDDLWALATITDRGPDNSATVWTQPAGWTLDSTDGTAASGSVSAAAAHRQLGAAGAYGGGNWSSTTTNNPRAIASLVIVNPAVASTPPTVDVDQNDDVAVVDVRGSTAGEGGTLSYSISPTTDTVEPVDGLFLITRTASEATFTITVTESPSALTDDTVVTVPAAGSGGDVLTMYVREGGVWV